MPRPVYSTRFISDLFPAGETDAYTVPEGFIAVLRDVDCYVNPGGGNPQIGTTATGGGLSIVATPEVGGSNQICRWRGRQVFLAGEVLSVYNLTASFYLIASGYLLAE